MSLFPRHSRACDLTGQRFGCLTAIEPTSERAWHSVVWICKCDCGATKPISAQRLTHGRIVSCGCGLKPEPLPPSIRDRAVFDRLDYLIAIGYGDMPQRKIEKLEAAGKLIPREDPEVRRKNTLMRTLASRKSASWGKRGPDLRPRAKRRAVA